MNEHDGMQVRGESSWTRPAHHPMVEPARQQIDPLVTVRTESATARRRAAPYLPIGAARAAFERRGALGVPRRSSVRAFAALTRIAAASRNGSFVRRQVCVVRELRFG
jgi:hypothetical protein